MRRVAWVELRQGVVRRENSRRSVAMLSFCRSCSRRRSTRSRLAGATFWLLTTPKPVAVSTRSSCGTAWRAALADEALGVLLCEGWYWRVGNDFFHFLLGLLQLAADLLEDGVVGGEEGGDVLLEEFFCDGKCHFLCVLGQFVDTFFASVCLSRVVSMSMGMDGRTFQPLN